MISDEKRREVAKRMRELPSDTYAALKEWEEGGLFIEERIGDEADYSQIHDAVIGCFPAEYMHQVDYEELHERLADLIDRPTCRNVYDEVYDEYEGGCCENGFKCSKCGELVEDCEGYRVKGTFNYCPNCGAEVAE